MRVIFKRLESEGFLSLGKVSVDFEGQGLVKVQGSANTSSFNKLESSNGSGKSSIFENIIWVLTGDTMRGISSNEVVNKYYEGYCYSELDFTVDDHEYKVIRSRSHPTHGTNLSIFIDGDDKSGKKLKESEALLQTYLPTLSVDILQSVIILGQGMPNKFTSLSPSGRKDRLEELSGSSSFIEKLKCELNLKKLNLTEKMNKISRDLSSVDGSIEAYTMANQRLKSTIDSLKATSYRTTQEINSEISNAQSQYDLLSDEMSETMNSNSQLVSRKSAYQSSLSTHKVQLTTLTTQLSELQKDICPTCKRPFTKSEDDLARISKLQSDISECQSAVNILESKIVSTDSLLRDNNAKYSKHQMDANELAREISVLRQELLDATSVETNISNATKSIDDNNQMIQESQSRKLEYMDEFHDVERRTNVVNYLLQQMSREFRGYLLQEVINYLNTRAKYYVDKLSTRSNLEIALDGNKITIYYNNRSYESLSGGERQRVDLAIQFALRDILSISTGFSCNLLVLDEVFDNLDSLGSTNLIKLISSNNLGIDSVFIITHHSDIPVPCDTTLLVEKNESGVSSIKVD